ncbi:MAG TPA: FtsX-like permease family protein, partial [Vicinamibacterales bacterium]
ENLRAGLSPVEARRQALLKFGSVEGIKDAYRDQRGLPLLETLSRDARHAIRGLRRTPAFTAAVIGIRTASGAQPAGLLGMFVRHGLWLCGIGAVLGLGAAAGLTRLMSSLLFGVTALDPLTYTAVSALLIVAGVLASYLPARRAIAVDPVQALRAE